jgi:hypothetical protein
MTPLFFFFCERVAWRQWMLSSSKRKEDFIPLIYYVMVKIPLLLLMFVSVAFATDGHIKQTPSKWTGLYHSSLWIFEWFFGNCFLFLFVFQMVKFTRLKSRGTWITMVWFRHSQIIGIYHDFSTLCLFLYHSLTQNLNSLSETRFPVQLLCLILSKSSLGTICCRVFDLQWQLNFPTMFVLNFGTMMSRSLWFVIRFQTLVSWYFHLYP